MFAIEFGIFSPLFQFAFLPDAARFVRFRRFVPDLAGMEVSLHSSDYTSASIREGVTRDGNGQQIITVAR